MAVKIPDLKSLDNMLDEIEDDEKEQNKIAESYTPWTYLTEYDFFGDVKKSINALQSIIPIDSNHFIVYHYEVDTESYHHTNKYSQRRFYIYNINDNKWIKSDILKLFCEDNPSAFDKKYPPKPKLIANTSFYNKKTNILTIYEQRIKRKLIEYDVNKNKWNTTNKKYKERIMMRPAAVSGYSGGGSMYMTYQYTNDYTKGKTNPTEQCILINNKIHSFGYDAEHNTIDHYVCNYFGDENASEERIKIDSHLFNDTKHRQFRFTNFTQIIYIKSKQCLYFLFERPMNLQKYSLLNKKWEIIKIYFKYYRMKGININDKYILFYGGWDKSNSCKSHQNIYIFDIKTENVMKSKIKLPLTFIESNGKLHAIHINKYDNNQLLLLINGFINIKINNI
eukprot:437974_1